MDSSMYGYTLILEFTISGPHKFQTASIISQNSKFRGPVDHINKTGAGTLHILQYVTKALFIWSYSNK